MNTSQHTAPRLTLDFVALRGDFPILRQEVLPGVPLVYLDSAATTQKPQVVIDALVSYYTASNANVHRALYRLAERSTLAYEEARHKIARFINAPDPRCIVYTSGTTAGINLVAYSWGDANVKEGDVIVVTEMEHHSNLIPWQLLAQRTGATLKYIPVKDDGTLDLDAYHKLLDGRVKLVALTDVSNVLGTVNPMRQIIQSAHRAGALVMVDAAQSVPHMPSDVQAMDCDFLVFSGHKMCAPTGIGVLYARAELLEAMPPFMGGGEMIRRVSLDTSTYADIPSKFEAGTPNISGAIVLGIAIDYLQQIGMDAIHAYETELTAFALERLRQVPGLKIRGNAPQRGGALSFEVPGVHPHDVAHFTNKAGIAIRAGHMCCQPLMRRLGVPALSRASLYFYNTKDDIIALAQALDKTQEFFSHGIR